MTSSFARSARSILGFVAVGCAAGAALADPKNPPPAPVTVVNTTANPVPVNGNMTVTGTPNVNVTNTSIPVTGSVNASQSGMWNVGITGTPAVKLAQTPYAVGSIGNCNSFFCFFSFPAVPDGKRLVITFVNVTVRPSATTTIVDFAELATTDTNNSNTLVTNDFGFTQVGHAGASNSFNSWVVNSQTLAFVAAGQSPELEADLGTSGTIAFASATLSGYLVDAP